MNRREFVAGIAVAGIVPGLGFTSQKKELFEISLAQWSLHKTIFGKKMDAGDFPKVAKDSQPAHSVSLLVEHLLKGDSPYHSGDIVAVKAKTAGTGYHS